ncbi:MAG: hypothetical protein U5K54_00430 [Cytophagales bacterium]|nr:hypothetical protein [Cytophagales bacterium]
MRSLRYSQAATKVEEPDQFDYPGRYIKLLWDGPNMKITNFDDANQFVKRDLSRRIRFII